MFKDTSLEALPPLGVEPGSGAALSPAVQLIHAAEMEDERRTLIDRGRRLAIELAEERKEKALLKKMAMEEANRAKDSRLLELDLEQERTAKEALELQVASLQARLAKMEKLREIVDRFQHLF